VEKGVQFTYAPALKTDVEHLARGAVDIWIKLAVTGVVKRYGKLEKGTATPLLHHALEQKRPQPPDPHARFILPLSMRDVEAAVPLWVTSTLGSSPDGE
jgi:hypothetical protein